MATYTTNLNLEKPATSENFNLAKINSNWDKIDAGVGQKSNRSDVYFANNYTYNPSGSIILPGFVTSGTTEIHLGWYAPRNLSDAPVITINNLVGTIRGPKGYVDLASSSSFDILNESTYTISLGIRSFNYQEIIIKKNTTLSNVDNNTPVIAWVYINATMSST